MKVSKIQAVKNLMDKNPSMTASEISKKLGIKIGYVYTMMSKIRKPKFDIKKIEAVLQEEASPPVSVEQVKDFVYSISLGRGTVDNINHPPHYTTGGMETIDFIEAKKLDYHLGNVVKYITRADHKGSKLENLKKAQWYLNRAVDNLTK